MVSVAGNPPASVTRSANTNVRVAVLVATLGAVKRACWVVAPVRMTAVPAVCVHCQLKIPFSGSEPLPFRLTTAPASTVWSDPAFAVGGWFWETVTVLPADQADSVQWLSRAWAFTVY